MISSSPTARPAARTLTAAAIYLAILVVWSWPLATRLGTDVLLSPPDQSADMSDWRLLTQNDQLLTIATIARNCHAILTGRPRGVIDQGLCFPTPNSVVLGEHLMEATLLGLPVYAVTGNAIATYNVVWATEILVAAVGMFALVYAVGGSFAAAWVAGLLFGFYPERIADQAHPAVTGTHWVPWVLLAYERLLATPTARRAATLAAAGALACLTGVYPTLVLATFAPTYGAMRAWQERRFISRRFVAALALSVLAVAVICGVLLSPYFSVGSTWGLRARFNRVYALYPMLLPGGGFSLGALAPLAALAFVPLARGRAGAVARAALLGAIVTILFVTGGPAWPDGPALRPLHAFLVELVPAIDLARVPAAVVVGAQLGVVLGAGVATASFLARLTSWQRVTVGVALAGVALGEYFYAPAAASIYGERHVKREVRNVEPDGELLAAYASFGERELDGAFLDLPYTKGRMAVLKDMPSYVYLSAYHLRPTAACYNSLPSPTADLVIDIVGRIPSAAAARELAAAGLRNIVVHETDVARDAAVPASMPDTDVIFRGPTSMGLRINAQPPMHSEPTSLRPLGFVSPQKLPRLERDASLALDVANRNSAVWAQPRPLRLQAAHARLQRTDDPTPAQWQDGVILLPLALDANASGRGVLRLSELPQPGVYYIDLEVPELGWKLTTGSEVVVE